MAALQAAECARRPVVVIGTAGDPRLAGFQAALARAGRAPATTLDYRDLAADPARAAARLTGPAFVRIESAGRDPQVLAGLLALGIEDCEREGGRVLARSRIEAAVADRGRLLPAHQLSCGLRAALAAVARQARSQPPHRAIELLPDPATVELAFDKTRCRDLLASRGLPVPRALPAPASFEALLAAMTAQAMPRVFVKLRHGSAAAGTVALAVSPAGVKAVSTVEVVASADGVRLYNTRDLRTYATAREVARLINALVPYGLHCEAWIPKAGIDGRVADLRVLVVAGEPVLRVVRRSVHPITNLHLGGTRCDAATLLSRMQPASVSALAETCRGVARSMPAALQLGIDIAVAAGLKRHYVLEVNAFGDLLTGVARDGLDAYDLQVAAMERLA